MNNHYVLSKNVVIKGGFQSPIALEFKHTEYYNFTECMRSSLQNLYISSEKYDKDVKLLNATRQSAFSTNNHHAIIKYINLLKVLEKRFGENLDYIEMSTTWYLIFCLKERLLGKQRV